MLEKLNAAMAALVDQETGLRGYLVSGDEAFLEPFKSGVNTFETRLAETKKLTADNAQQQERLNKVDELVATWVKNVAEKEIALMGDR